MFRQRSTGGFVGLQLFHCGVPIDFRRAFRTASRFPELVREGFDLMLFEWDDAMRSHSRLRVLMSLCRVLEGLPCMLVPRQVILFSVLLGDTMGMCGEIVQFGGSLVILIVRSVVITCRHNQMLTICPDLLWASFASL